MTSSAKKKHGALRKIGSFLGVLALVAVAIVAVTNAAIVLDGEDRIIDGSEVSGVAATFDADAIVVMGASVYGDSPSTILADRLDAAAELYFAGVAPKIIVSGTGSDPDYNEPEVMKNYLISLGVPSEDIFCDRAGFSTYDTMYRVVNVFGAERVVVVTQTYHLYRAMYVGNALGIEAIGFASDYSDYEDQLWYDLREVFARTKDFFMALAEVPSEVIGEKVSLDQSGDVTNSA